MRRVLELCEKRGVDFRTEVAKEFQNSIVVTSYNNKTYPISCIAFDVTPKSKFIIGSCHEEITFAEYYQERYHMEIQDLNQHMLLSINKRTGQESYLVPELCRMTGVSSELMDDFRAMREIKTLTHSDAPARAKECVKLFDTIAKNQQCVEIMKEMGIEFNQEPVKLKAYKLEAGKMIMGINEATN